MATTQSSITEGEGKKSETLPGQIIRKQVEIYTNNIYVTTEVQ